MVSEARHAGVFDVIGKRNWFFAFSLLLTIPGLIFLVLGPVTGGKVGLQFAIDFTGGTVWSIRFEDATVTPQQVRTVVEDQGFEATVLKTGEFIEIRTKEAALAAPAPAPTAVPTAAPSAAPSASAGASGSPDPSASAAPSASPEPSPSAVPGANLPTTGKLGEVRFALEEELGTIAEQQSLAAVGAVVSSDLITQALTLIFFGAIGILLWIWYRFRDFKMGATALVALVHDILVVVGAFAILGTFAGIQVDSLFVTAMLTVIGFSVHDTIVVFDRVRENRSRHAGEPFARIVNHSILQTFGRSITTSLTVVIVLLALLLFAGQAIGVFVFALLLGIISGTYSSIFIASPLLVGWHDGEDRRRERETAARPGRRATT